MRSFNLTSQGQSPLLKMILLLLSIGFLTLPSSAIGQSPDSQQPSDRLLTHPNDVKSLPSQNKRWALLIGVDRYEDSNISSLKGAANDARSLNQALVNYGGFPQDQVIVLSSDEPFERQPTRKNILRRLSNLAGLVPKDGLLLISFAGHGIDRNGQGFLIPSDATFSEDIRLLEETAISVNSVKQRIRDTGVQQVMIFLDSCRSYPTGRSDSPNPLTNAFTKVLNFDVTNKEVMAFVVLYATALGGRAYEYAEKQQGYFSWAIAQALKGAAANERGEVTLGALVKYLENTVPKLVSIDYGAKVVQRPFANIEGYRAAELVVAVTTPNGKPVHASPTSSDAELDLWSSIKNSENAEDFKKYLRQYPDGLFADVARGRLEQQNARRALVVHPGVRYDEKAGRVLLSYGQLNREGRIDPILSYDQFLTPLTQTLKQANLSVTSEASLAQKDRVQIMGAVREIKQGRTTAARSAAFIVALDVTFALQDLPAYQGMEISVVNITLRAIDLETGEIAAIENVEGKGFGTGRDQARVNALKEAGQHISSEFVYRVAERCGRPRPGVVPERNP